MGPTVENYTGLEIDDFRRRIGNTPRICQALELSSCVLSAIGLFCASEHLQPFRGELTETLPIKEIAILEVSAENTISKPRNFVFPDRRKPRQGGTLGERGKTLPVKEIVVLDPSPESGSWKPENSHGELQV